MYIVLFFFYTTHTRPFDGPLSRTTRVSRYQKGKTNLDFTEARDIEWQWHQLGRMQVCISLQTDNHASTPQLSFYRPGALPAAQPTASKHRRHTIPLGVNKVAHKYVEVCLSALSLSLCSGASATAVMARVHGATRRRPAAVVASVSPCTRYSRAFARRASTHAERRPVYAPRASSATTLYSTHLFFGGGGL